MSIYLVGPLTGLYCTIFFNVSLMRYRCLAFFDIGKSGPILRQSLVNSLVTIPTMKRGVVVQGFCRINDAHNYVQIIIVLYFRAIVIIPVLEWQNVACVHVYSKFSEINPLNSLLPFHEEVLNFTIPRWIVGLPYINEPSRVIRDCNDFTSQIERGTGSCPPVDLQCLFASTME